MEEAHFDEEVEEVENGHWTLSRRRLAARNTSRSRRLGGGASVAEP